MRYRVLGKTGWEVSAVSMGCWLLGGQWDPVSEQQGIETVHAALDAGVNLFDTADSYGPGVSEQVLGKALAGKRDDVYIATKVGNWGGWADDRLQFKSVFSVIECCHASLHRLGTDRIDLYQLHIPKPENPEMFVEAFETLKEQGKIRHFGISTNDLWALEAMNTNGTCATLQANYSILARKEETDQFPYCIENNIGVLLRGPLAMGLLSGKFTPETKFTDSVRERFNNGPAREGFLDKLAKVEKLRPLEREGRTLAQAALQFTLAHPAVTCPIPGMRTPDQARNSAASADGELSKEDLELIDQVIPPKG